MITTYKQQDNSLAKAIYTIENSCCNVFFSFFLSFSLLCILQMLEVLVPLKKISVICTAAKLFLKLFVRVVFTAKRPTS